MEIHKLDANDPDLQASKFLDAVYKTINYANELGGIPLTKSGAFNRKFCTWAADNFNWPEYKIEELMKMNKVIDEIDVPPVERLHDFLYNFKYGRHFKGKFQISKRTLKDSEDKSTFYLKLTADYLLHYEHEYLRPTAITPQGNWVLFLNVINVEAHAGGTTECHLLRTFFGYEKGDWQKDGYWAHSSFLLWSILKPLTWMGFLEETHPDGRYKPEKTIYTKTALWRKTFSLDTDSQLKLRIVN